MSQKAYIILTKLTPWSRELLDKLTGMSYSRNSPAFYGTRRFIAVFTTARHWFLSRARYIKSTPSHPISL
jgi:hypothetical protein